MAIVKTMRLVRCMGWCGAKVVSDNCVVRHQFQSVHTRVCEWLTVAQIFLVHIPGGFTNLQIEVL